MKISSIKAVLRAIIPQHRCVGVFSAPAPTYELQALTGTIAIDLAPLEAHLRHDRHLQLMATMAPSRWARGDRLWIFRFEETLVHLAWTRYDERLDLTHELGPGCLWSLPKGATVIYDCYTLPHARRQGFYRLALQWLRQYHGSCCWIYCEPRNRPSWQGILGAGFSCLGSVCRWQWAGQYWGKIPEMPLTASAK